MNNKVDLKVPKKYMQYFALGYAAEGEYPCMPVKSKKEAIEWLKLGEKEKNYDKLMGLSNEK